MLLLSPLPSCLGVLQIEQCPACAQVVSVAIPAELVGWLVLIGVAQRLEDLPDDVRCCPSHAPLSEADVLRAAAELAQLPDGVPARGDG